VGNQQQETGKQDVLHLYLDTETRSGAELKQVGVYPYVEDAEFRVIMLQWALGNGEVHVEHLWDKDNPDVQLQPSAEFKYLFDAENVLLVAHNASFDRVVLREIGFDAPPSRWRDTMAAAKYYNLPAGLGKLGDTLQLEQVKQPGSELIGYYCKPRKNLAYGFNPLGSSPKSNPEKWDMFTEYAEQDIHAVRAVHGQLGDLPEFEQRVWEFNETMNDRGVCVDYALVERWCREWDELADAARERFIALVGATPLAHQAVNRWVYSRLGPLKELGDHPRNPGMYVSLDADHTLFAQAAALEQGDDTVLEALSLREELKPQSRQKLDAMLRMSPLALRGMFNYYGASTGRYSSRFVQLQNISRDGFDTEQEYEQARSRPVDSLRGLNSLVRTALIPESGCAFAIADLSAIESRVLAWYAQEQWKLNEFNGAGKIYEATAAKMLGKPIEDVTKAERQSFKAAELACGFGGAENALIRMGALKQGIAPEDLPGLVAAWREANPNIVRLWGDWWDAFVDGDGVTVSGVRFDTRGRGRAVTLPSGRQLFYYDLEAMPPGEYKRADGTPYTRESWWWRYSKPSGSGLVPTAISRVTLTENIIQATARDILVGGLLRADAIPGAEVLMHVHDEIIVECEQGQETEVLSLLLAAMTAGEEWTKPANAGGSLPLGLPLAAAGFTTTKFYRKG